MSLDKNYKIPDWSSKPENSFMLEIQKEGTSIGEINLSEKATYMFGRDKNVCDFHLEHPSSSRTHAVIQFGHLEKHNTDCFIYDQGSGHGTFVNKKRLYPSQFVPQKSGDWIRFGESSRNYIQINKDMEINSEEEKVEEPKENDEKNAIEDFKKQQKTKTNKELYNDLQVEHNVIKKNKPQYNRMDINWGQVDDHIIYANSGMDEHILRTDLLRMLPNLTDNQISKIESFEKKHNKLKILEKDYNTLITKKENSGVNEAETSLIRELDIRMNKLANELSQAEENLKNMLGLEDAELRFTRTKEKDTFDDDEFFDQTKSSKNLKNTQQHASQQKLDTKVENYSEIKEEYEQLIQKKKKLSKELYNLAMNQTDGDQDDLDEFEKFMLQNDQSIKEDKRHKLVQEMKDVETKIDEASWLMNYIKPDIKVEKEEEVVKRLEDQKLKRKEIKKYKETRKNNIMEELKNKAKMVARLDNFATPQSISANAKKISNEKKSDEKKNHENSSDFDSEEEEKMVPVFVDTTEEEQLREMREGIDSLDDEDEMFNLKKRHFEMLDNQKENQLKAQKKVYFGPKKVGLRDIEEGQENLDLDQNDSSEKKLRADEYSWQPTHTYDDLEHLKPKGY